MSTMYLPVYTGGVAGDNKFVITSYEAVFKSKQGALDKAEELIHMGEIRLPVSLDHVLELEPDKGLEGVHGNLMFLNVLFIEGELFDERELEGQDAL